jgi:hypothetical protein
MTQTIIENHYNLIFFTVAVSALSFGLGLALALWASERRDTWH